MIGRDSLFPTDARPRSAFCLVSPSSPLGSPNFCLRLEQMTDHGECLAAALWVVRFSFHEVAPCVRPQWASRTLGTFFSIVS